MKHLLSPHYQRVEEMGAKTRKCVAEMNIVTGFTEDGAEQLQYSK